MFNRESFLDIRSFFKSKSFIAVLTLFFLLNNNLSFSQSIKTNEGTNFWFAYPNHSDTYTVGYWISITSFVNATGTVSVPGMSFTQNFTVTPGIVTRVALPNTVEDSVSEVIENQAVHVISTNIIALFSSEEGPIGPRNDNSLLLPDSVLGNDYYVMSYDNRYAPGRGHSEFIINTPGTSVNLEITPSVLTSAGHLGGVPFTITLNSGQCYMVQSDSDLTGSRVRALNTAQTFAVSGGNSLTSVSCGATVDNLYEELFPVSSWGKNYVFVSTPKADDLCRIFASCDSSHININGTLVTMLQAGKYFDTTVTSSTPDFISADNPISVGRYLKTSGCNNDLDGLGDPSLIIVDANEQMFLDSATFYATNNSGIDSNYIQIITRTADVNTVLLDGVNVGPDFIILPSNIIYSYANISIPAAYHKITSTGTGFLAYMCGMGSPTSTASAAGVCLLTLPPFILTTTAVPDTSSCTGDNGTATVVPSGGNGNYTYSWMPGGQTTQNITGLSAGNYSVTVTNTNRCNVISTQVSSVSLSGFSPASHSWEIPNVFTPNGDSINDVFKIATPNKCITYTIKIYDRWGVLMFENGSGISWDGKTNKGLPVPAGTYYFILIDSNGTTVKTGFLTLLR